MQFETGKAQAPSLTKRITPIQKFSFVSCEITFLLKSFYFLIVRNLK